MNEMNYEIHTVCLWCEKWLCREEEETGIAFCSDCYKMYYDVSWKIQ